MLNYKEVFESENPNYLFETLSSIFEKIENEDNENAFITLDKEMALRKAKDSALRITENNCRKLEGMLISVKDNISTKNLRTTAGSKILHNYIPVFSATIVERLEAEGAIIVGKTNMDEFAMGSSSETSYFGAVKNPINDAYVAGGSSGGSAVAVKNGYCHISIGSDTGGSVRLPASYCGLYGFKPTYGRISRYGLIALASSMDTIGLISSELETLEMLFNVISGEDSLDATSLKNDFILDNELHSEVDYSKIVVGKISDKLLSLCDEEVKNIYKKWLETLKDKNIKTVEIELEYSDIMLATYQILMTAEASSNLARYDGNIYGYVSETNLPDKITATRTEGFGIEVKRRILLGNYVLSKGYKEGYYLKARKARDCITNNFNKIFLDVDFIFLPVSTCKPFKIGEKINEPTQMYSIDIFNIPANLAGLPALSFVAGKSKENIPIGMQFYGKYLSDKKLINFLKTFDFEVA